MGVRSEPCTKAKLLKGVGKGQSLLWQHASKYYTERLFLVDLYKGRCNLLCSKGHLYVYLGVNVVDDKMMILFVCIWMIQSSHLTYLDFYIVIIRYFYNSLFEFFCRLTLDKFKQTAGKKNIGIYVMDIKGDLSVKTNASLLLLLNANQALNPVEVILKLIMSAQSIFYFRRHP